MRKFQQIYLHMFFQEKGILQFDYNKFDEFLNNAYWITNVINQKKELNIDVPDQLIQYCLDNSRKIISTNTIIKLMKYSKHYFNISLKKQFDLIIYFFNFDSNNQINTFLFQSFDIKDQKILNQNRDKFKNKCGNTFGFCSKYDDLYICGVNTNQNKIGILETTYHQLSHYIQNICNIHKTKQSFQLNDNLIKKLQYNNISEKDINYLFNTKQFIPHLDDLKRQMLYLYKLKYKNICKCPNNFINNIIKQQIKKPGINNQLQQDLISLNIFNMQGLYLLKAAYLTHFKFQFILKHIENICLEGHKND